MVVSFLDDWLVTLASLNRFAFLFLGKVVARSKNKRKLNLILFRFCCLPECKMSIPLHPALGDDSN